MASQLTHSASPASPSVRDRSRWWIAGLVVLGVVLRLAQYLFNRSLWLDEINLADNLLSRTYSQLWAPLDGGQYAPIGFLWVTKFLLTCFGSSEAVFRLLPLVCGLLSLPLFASLARQQLRGLGAVVAVLLFVVSDQLIYYSSELKPYSVDVAATTWLLWLTMRRDGVFASTKRTVACALTGAILLWFSFPVLLVLPAIGIAAGTTGFLRGDASQRRHIALVGVLWAVSFAALYSLSLRDNAVDPFVRNFWQEADAFVPLSGAALPWVSLATQDLFVWDHHTIPWLSWLSAASGLVLLIVRRSAVAWVTLLLLGLTLLASALERYPFQRRLLLFAWPLLPLLIGGSIQALEGRGVLWKWVACAVAALIAFGPTVQAFDKLAHPRQRQEVRPVVEYFMAHRQPGDELYLFYATLAQFRYYAKRAGLQPGEYLIGSHEPGDWGQEVGRLRGQPRVWFVFLSPRRQKRVSGHAEMFLNTLHDIGTELDHFQSVPFDLVLFDLTVAQD